ncbi:MAG: hypothetical protein ABIG45_06035 [Bacillota bacterium]
MKTDEYREHLRKQGVPEAEIEEQINVIQAFEEGLWELGEELASAGKTQIGLYAKRMIENGSNTLQNFETLETYALWLNLRGLYILLVEVTDCHNGMEKLKEIIEKRHGTEIRGQIFREPLPPLGADEHERCEHTKLITARMAELLSKEERRKAWFLVQHGISEEDWRASDAAEKERYSGCKTLGEFLELKRKYRNAALTRMHDQNELWYTMELTDDVLQFLTGEYHMQIGEYNGRNGIVVTKVPYQAGRFLRETDEKLKRYYACHCPLIREAILRDEPITADVCYCSLGHASHFLSGMGLDTLKGEVMESAAQGDARCRFIFYLPKETNVQKGGITAFGS